MAVPKKFTVKIISKKWKQISPMDDSVLRKSWTNVFYSAFKEFNPCCPIAFKYQWVRKVGSRKRTVPYFRARAICTFSTCRANYTFTIKDEPTAEQKNICVHVVRTGSILHKKGETKFRRASFGRRGKIAKELKKGVSNAYYSRLAKTPQEQLSAGNLSESLTRNVLKAISAEINKSTRLHDNITLELMLTQQILRECHAEFNNWPGYIQSLQLDPFSVHLYTEEGIQILVAHLRKRVSLYLDATGGVVAAIPGQKKRMLYYSLTLPGMGKYAPPLPVAEMISNDHDIPTISFWLGKFILSVSKCTRIRIHKVEVDYSWALFQSVLSAFNKENINSRFRSE